MSPRRTLFLLVVLAVSAPPARAQQRDSIEALKHLTLDQLMNIDVMSVSLRPQRLFETPSAIQVITQDDIRASGATSLQKRCASLRICRLRKSMRGNGPLAPAGST